MNKYMLIWLVCLLQTALWAQQPTSVTLKGESMRFPITVGMGNTLTFSLEGLNPEGSYRISGIHDPMAGNLPIEITVNDALLGSAGVFSTTSTSAVVKVFNPSETKQLWISVFNRYQSSSNAAMAKAQNLLVGQSVTAEQMIRDHLIGGDCYEVKNITYTGNQRYRGIFTNGAGSIGINDGIVLGTGDLPFVVPGPNTLPNATYGEVNVRVQDSDLNAIYDSTYDIAKLEFDFVPTSSNINFRFVFASEEYCEFTQSQFKDVFGFFISGPGITGVENMAKVPFTNTPISISTINHVINSGYYVPNIPDSSTTLQQPVCFGHGAANVNTLQWTQFDGFTTVLTASANVIPCQTYHLKMAIADVADPIYDSAVFFEESSFNAGGSVTTEVVYPSTDTIVYEGCAKAQLVFTRSLGDINIPLAIPILPSGTALNGVDYLPLPDTVYMAAGESTLSIDISVINDGQVEGLETIEFTIPNACKCSEQSVFINIADQQPLLGSLSSNKICFGEVDTLRPIVSGGLQPLSFEWSTGSLDNFILASTAGLYEVTVSDACGQTLLISTNVNVTDSFGITLVKTQIGQSDTFELVASTNLSWAQWVDYGWSPKHHLSCPECSSTLAWPPLTTTYTYSITSLEGCTVSVSSLIEADGVLAYFVPNVFSPNDDNKNDLLWILGRTEDISSVKSFNIYDRWGNKIFSRGRSLVNDMSQGWDGTFRGTPLAPGVFAWTAELEVYTGQIFRMNGDVTLLR